jgi:DNA primase
VPKLQSPVAFDADDQALFKQVLDYYHDRLLQSKPALDYLQSRTITPEAIETFRIGLADRTLGLRLPQKNRRDGAEVRQRLTRLGLYRQSGHEHFNGCAVFPICSKTGEVTEVYGRRIGQQASGVYHLYLPGPHRGLFNPQAFDSPEVILTESVIDALSFWCAGLRSVTCIWGTEGFSEDHQEAFRQSKTQRVLLAYDGDEAGDRAAERDAARLGSLGIDCHRVGFPRGMDPNEYARKVQPARKSLPLVLQSARPVLRKSSEALAKDRPSRINKSDTVPSTKPAANCLAAKEGSPVETKEATPSNPIVAQVKEHGEDVALDIGDRSYRVRGLARNATLEVLKINLRVMHEGLFHVDNLDLYQARQRNAFILAATEETGLKAELLKRDLGKVLLALENLQEKRLREDLQIKPSGPKLTDDERKSALELLRDPHLLERILCDLDACGVIGEETNKLAGYLAAVSRKLDRPLAIIIQSTSAAGKTSLMDAILELMPQEERTKYSAMTGQSLYYLGESDLKHKILAIVEEEGAEKASYALKLLQSEGELTIASTGKDDNGRLKTEEYHVEGPAAIFLTTTAIDIDEELLNRCLVLTVDESREQTQAIHTLQRDADTLDGLKRKVEQARIIRTHRNAQRLLRPLHVVNPFAPRLTFRSDRTRTRRDHLKYLTLIRAIALLHQHQRFVKKEAGLEYIEVTLADIASANRIAHEVLGRSLDELPPQTRRLLGLLEGMVAEISRKKGIDRDQCVFTRREVRAFTGWSEFQTRTHLSKLQDMEYVLAHYGRRGQNFVYELTFDGDAESKRPQLIGLIDVDRLKSEGAIQSTGTKTAASSSSTSPHRARFEKRQNAFNHQPVSRLRRTSWKS